MTKSLKLGGPLVENSGRAAIYKPELLTKVVALRHDLNQRKRNEPNLRAVVYTQHVAVHESIVRGVARDGFQVYQFTGSSDSNKRDQAIRR